MRIYVICLISFAFVGGVVSSMMESRLTSEEIEEFRQWKQQQAEIEELAEQFRKEHGFELFQKGRLSNEEAAARRVELEREQVEREAREAEWERDIEKSLQQLREAMEGEPDTDKLLQRVRTGATAGLSCIA